MKQLLNVAINSLEQQDSRMNALTLSAVMIQISLNTLGPLNMSKPFHLF